MLPEELRRLLDDRDAAKAWLKGLGISKPRAGHANLTRLAELGVPLDLLTCIATQLADELPKSADADMAFNNLERFLSAARSPLALAALFERDREALPTLLQIFSTSQYLSDVLITDASAYELVRATQGQPVSHELLTEEIVREVESLPDASAAMAALRRFKRRETLRIAYGDIIRVQPVETVTRQISYLADAIVEAALRFARPALEVKHGVPRAPAGERAEFVVLALGKLGGLELNYSSDIDLVFLYEAEGRTDGPRAPTNQEFFERLARELVQLLSDQTDLGFAYRVDLRLRPEGSRGAAATSIEAAITYYDNKGRTWERQAYVKARPIAGDLPLGRRFLARLEPWIYRRFLSRADITGIKALKRRIEKQTAGRGDDQRDVKTGRGGIRDIEFVIQFLQLLNGSDLPEVRTGNTIEAIARLENSGCLTPQERSILEPNYALLRKLEHRLQVMFDLKTHALPTDEEELRKLAVRMDYGDEYGEGALAAFQHDLDECTEKNRQILDHLLHDAFGDEPRSEPEVDLVNDPSPSAGQIDEVLGKYGFTDSQAAYANLMSLATEPIRFLSTRRCRHFLASIAPRLLAAVAGTPSPDTTLVNLSRVSDSLGGKAALWELFSFNRPSMNLYVTLCAACPYLASILTSNPGMIDELVDSLLLEKLPTLEMLEEELADLCRGAEDLDPILHSFKDAQHLRVGVRDILGKDDIQATHAALADVAEACVRRIAMVEHAALVEKFGRPTIGPPKEDDETDRAGEPHPRVGEPCELIVLALGKLGGREPNYHSDLDLVFLFEAEGWTEHRGRSKGSTTTNSHFFSELGQRIIRRVGRMGPHGRLFEVDMRLRPTGKSGALALPIAAFLRYFTQGAGQLWERQALCKARVLLGSPRAAEATMEAVYQGAFAPKWRPEYAEEIRQMREKLQGTASERNLKRASGGTMDTEFLVQMLQLKHAWDDPTIRVPGTLEALPALRDGGYLDESDADYFMKSYRFQRSVEARIRLMYSSGRHELPTDGEELAKLAFLLGYRDPRQLENEAFDVFRENRERFNRIVATCCQHGGP